MKRLVVVLAPALAVLALACFRQQGTSVPWTGAKSGQGTRFTAADAGAGDDETAIDDAWFAGAAAESDVVTRGEAQAFIDATFAKVERHLYDPALIDVHGRAAREAAKGALAGKERLTRQDVVDAMNQALRGYGLSHLGIATPTKLRARFRLDGGAVAPVVEKREHVAGEMHDGVGIIRIDSFLVPEITHDAVRRAFEGARDARAVVIDLRGNGGGSASSVVYTAEYVVGPNVLVEIVQTRKGRQRRVPHDMKGFFSDAENDGSTADLALGKREGFVRWWTPSDAPPAPRRPTYVLVDEHCASSCEVFAAMMIDTGAAKVLGRKTPGEVLAAQGVKTSWNGYLLVVPFGTVLSPKGRVIEGTGVQPDVPLDACGEGHPAEACLAAALEIAKR